MLTKAHRLSAQRDVSSVYRNGKSVRSVAISLKFTRNQLEHNRLAVVVSKKVAKQAVVRNRIRRRIYEYVRAHWQELSPGNDIILSVFASEVSEWPSTKISQQLDELLVKAGLKTI